MYVARLAGTDQGFIVKRMPNTGSHHAPDCPSYEPPAELSGLGQVLGSAITEDPATGETTLKLDFPFTKFTGRSTMPAEGNPGNSVTTDGTKLSLRGLLHYLWDQAELTRWQPSFAGKRTWATVRKHLLHAAQNKIARGDALQARLYIPEMFAVEHREAINARRVAQWLSATAAPGKPQQLMLMIAEVKEIVPARYGYKAIIKHVPDQAFVIDAQLYRRLGRRFEGELSLWGATDTLHMVMISTFGVSEVGIPTIAEVSLMPVTAQWLPVENLFEQQLLDKLLSSGRSFIKGLRYNLPADHLLANALLTDAGQSSVALCIALRSSGQQHANGMGSCVEPIDLSPVWLWHSLDEAMPALPVRMTDGLRVR
jgi:hypothetical protein